MEIWKNIKEYENIYQVSNLGRIKSLNYKRTGKEQILKQMPNNKGYATVELYQGKNRKKIYVHRLVAEAFIDNPNNLPYIDHINTNKTDNRVENLRWVTAKENSNNPLTVNNCSTSANKKNIIQLDKNGFVLKEWHSITIASKTLGISKSNIINCCKNKYGFKSAGGYKWQYVI